MPGNEESVIKFLVLALEQKRSIELPILGKITDIHNPTKIGKQKIKNTEDLINYSSSDKYKKADVYLNNFGISIKEHISLLYNKIQRKHLPDLKRNLFPDREDLDEFLFKSIDNKINEINKGSKRDIPWNKVISEQDFYVLLEFLMMKGYASDKISNHPADYILIAPKHLDEKNVEDIKVYKFRDYFKKYKENIVIAARKTWIGSNSKSENRRAVSMNRSPENKNWVFENISGKPKKWDLFLPKRDRREIFYLNINTVR